MSVDPPDKVKHNDIDNDSSPQSPVPIKNSKTKPKDSADPLTPVDQNEKDKHDLAEERREDLFRITQLDIGDVENAIFREKWWQLWCVLHYFIQMSELKITSLFHRRPKNPPPPPRASLEDAPVSSYFLVMTQYIRSVEHHLFNNFRPPNLRPSTPPNQY